MGTSKSFRSLEILQLVFEGALRIFMERQRAIELDHEYDAIVGKLIRICQAPENWSTSPKNIGPPK